MKILVVHNRYRSAQPSGENAVVDDERRLLTEKGCNVERLELASDDIATWPPQKLATLPLRVVWSTEGYRRTANAIERTRPDVVHFHNTFPLISPSALWAARRSGVTVVQTLHNFRPLCAAATFVRDGRICEDCLGRLPMPALRHGCYRGSKAATGPVAMMIAFHRLLHTWRRCVDRFIVPSNFARAKYVEAGWRPSQLVVKYNTVPDPGAQHRGVGSGFVCLSRLAPEKGVDVLLQAWAEAYPQNGHRLTVVGSGESESRLREQADRLPGVDFTGQLDRRSAMNVLVGARALIVPSRGYELFPRTIAEAYALGVPVIAPRLGSLAEIIAHERTGLLVEPDSPVDLAEALICLGESPRLAAELGRGARDAYEQILNPSRATGRLIEIFEEACGAAKAA